MTSRVVAMLLALAPNVRLNIIGCALFGRHVRIPS